MHNPLRLRAILAAAFVPVLSGDSEFQPISTAISSAGVPAGPTPITYGACKEGAIDQPGDMDSYTFMGVERQVVNASLEHGAANLALYLTGPGGPVASCGPGWWFCEIDTLVLPDSGAYTLTVDGAGGDTDNYRICLSRLDGDAVPIEFDQCILETISPIGDQDSFTFLAEEGLKLNAALEHGAANLALHLTGPNGRMASCGPGWWFCEIDTLILPDTGAYTLTVDGAGGATDNYRICLNRLSPVEPTTWGRIKARHQP